MMSRIAVLCGAVLLWGLSSSLGQPPPALSTVAGMVVASDGKTPVAKRPVRLTPQTDPGVEADPKRTLTKRTDAEGRFTFTRVPEGAYTIGVPEGQDTVLAEREFTVRGAQDAEFTLVLTTYQAIRGRFLDPDGMPLAGQDVRLYGRYRTGEGSTTGRSYTVTTDDNGAFLTVMPAEIGSASISARVAGVGWFQRGNVNFAQIKFDLGDIQLEQGGQIIATVRNKDTGDVIENARVSTYMQSSSGNFGGSGPWAQTDENGRAVIDALPPGTYSVSSSLKGFIGGRAGEVSITVDGAPPEVALELEPAVRLAGVVKAGPNRKPVKGAKVSISRYGSPRTTDENGRFEFTQVRRQVHEITAKLPPYLPVTKSVEVTKDTTDVEIVLEREGLKLIGRLTGDDGEPLPEAYVAVIDPEAFRGNFEYRVQSETFDRIDRWPWDQGNYSQAKANDQGLYEVKGLAPGSYHVLGLSPGLPIAHKPDVQIGNRSTPVAELTIGWNQPLMVRGKLTDADGNPVANKRFSVRLKSDRRTRSTSAKTGADGTYWARIDRPGTYELSVRVGDLGSAKHEGVVLSQEDVTPAVDLQLTPPRFTRADYGSIAGVLHMPDGQTPAQYAFVYPYREGEEEWPDANSTYSTGDKTYRSRTRDASPVGENGEFVVRDLPPGKYSLRAVPWRPDDYQAKPLAEALAGTTPVDMVDIEVGPKQQVTGIEGKLGAAGMVKGVVKAAETGEPIANAWIRGYRQSRGDDQQLPAMSNRYTRAQSAADGTFTLASLQPGTYQVSASATDRKYQSRQGIEIEAGQTVENMTFELEQQFFGALEGVITMPDGRTPAAGAKVYVGAPGEYSQYFPEPTKTTDGQGKFHLDKLVEGEHNLVVTFPEHAAVVVTNVKVERDKTATVERSLAVGGTVSGTATGEGGKALEGEGYVVLSQADSTNFSFFHPNNMEQRPGLLAGKVGPGGKYQIAHVPSGKYVANVWVDNRVIATNSDVEVKDGQEAAVEFVVAPPKGVVRGTVTRTDGTPVEKAQIMLIPAKRPGSQTGITAMAMGQRQGQAKDGKYTIEQVPPGEYWVMCMVTPSQAGARGPEQMVGGRHPEKITVTNDAPVEGIDFAFGEGATVTGVVVDADGEPVAGARVMSMPSDRIGSMWGAFGFGGEEGPPLYFSMALCDKEGKYTMEGLPDGTYVFSAMVQDQQHLPGDSEEFTVQDGKAVADVTIEVKKGDFQKWIQEKRKELQEKLGVD